MKNIASSTKKYVRRYPFATAGIILMAASAIVELTSEETAQN